MTLLGIDPGLAQTGYGVVQRQGPHLRAAEFGLIRTSAHLPLPERVNAIHQRVTALLKQYRPQCVVLERLYALRDGSTGLAIGQAMGVILLAAWQAGVQVVEYTPTEVKRAVVGYGRADKEQVQYMVQRLLGLAEAPRPDHAADALALCICHAHTSAGAAPLPAGRPVPSSKLADRIVEALEADEAQRAVHRERRGRK